MAFLDMAGIASIMPFMAVVANPDVIQTNRWLKQAYDFFGFTSSHDFLFFLGSVVLGMMIFSNLAKFLVGWLALRFDNGINYSLARRLLAAYLARPYDFFLNRNVAEMGKNVLTEVRTVIGGVLSAGMYALQGIVISFFILALLAAVNPYIAANILVVLGICYGLVYIAVRRRLARIGEEQVESNVQKYKAAGEALGGIKDLKILGRERLFLEKFSFYAQRHARNNVTAGVISQLPRYALEVMAFGGILLIVLILLGAERKQEQMIPLLALYALAGYRLLPALQSIFAGIASVRFNLAALDVLHRDLIENRGEVDPEMALAGCGNLDPLPFTRELELIDVTFRYAEGQEPVLKNLHLTIPINNTIGFVGATGSGKTTAVDIILGLLSPSSGEIQIDGTHLNGKNLARWQRNLGYVPQTIFLCDDTVTRNIAFGVPDAEIDHEAVARAARIANLDSFVREEMPEGYDTVIGDRGIRLSGGQRQRIGIARALYSDPAVLILDEATSALDGLTEEAVMDAISHLSRKKTILMIAHRLTTVKDCDVIYLLDHGRIVNQGSYDDLEKSSAWFRAAARIGSTSTKQDNHAVSSR
ncbi:MAG: ABC transporter ATP-binding protein [Desulfuromonadaceae bacterium]|nr:ABC transporter ATP-binding protein [Desulfuromonadaceae bacterium]